MDTDKNGTSEDLKWVGPDLWVENALIAFADEQLPSREHGEEPILSFKFDEQGNAAAWRKLRSQEDCSDVQWSASLRPRVATDTWVNTSMN